MYFRIVRLLQREGEDGGKPKPRPSASVVDVT